MCKFNFNGEEYWTEAYSIVEFRYGFWINEYKQYTTNIEHEKYWIPPSAIKYVVKE
tara:strand:- start:1649 stop:1816 length:168 start_codon:yes stop_codon:yes gene_type:complete